MHQFVVLFSDEIPPEVLQLAESTFTTANVFQVSDKALLVRSHSADPASVTMAVGLHADAPSPVAGVVLKLNGTYQGYHHPELWEWLAGVEVGV